MKKFTIILVLCITYINFIFGQTANDFTISLQGTGSSQNIIITGYKGVETNVVIPSQIDGVPVTGIGENAFRNKNITHITLSSSITSIGDDAFNECKKLVSIMVDSQNNTYSSIDGVLFSKDGYSLFRFPEGKSVEKTYTIPEKVESIERSAFYGCGLEEVTFPDNLLYIGDWVFAECWGLCYIDGPLNGNLVIPKYVFYVGSRAFSNCWNIVFVKAPPILQNSNEDSFIACFNLKSVESYNEEDYLKDIGTSNGKAEFYMGLINHFIKKNFDAAIYWFQKSAEQGNKSAIGFLESISKQGE
jgi:hypothetical protein